MSDDIDLEENLQLFARWESVVPYFSLNERGKNDPYIRVIKPMLKRLERKAIGVQGVSYLTNYYGFFAYSQSGEVGKVHGLIIFLSLLAPIAVLGRRTGQRLENGKKIEVGSFLELAEVISPDDAKSEFEATVVQEVRSTDYSFFSKEEVSKPLPEIVKIRHHSQPDKRYFHAVFDCPNMGGSKPPALAGCFSAVN